MSGIIPTTGPLADAPAEIVYQDTAVVPRTKRSKIPRVAEAAQPPDLRACLRAFADAMQDRTAALFLGAGMSRQAGFVDWRGLLRDIAREIELDVDREADLPAVVQYYLNRRGHERGPLNQIILNAFGRSGQRTENHSIIARLPISTIWTTNFDGVMEEALLAAGRIPDVKKRDVDFSVVRPERDITVYKMHGDISEPDCVVISSDDYERYSLDHPLFQKALEGDLVTKRMLFLGLSFTDPNLRYVLGHLRALLKNNKRQHFAVIRRARFNEHLRPRRKAQEDYEYSCRKQMLQIEDLRRYGIETILIDRYEEVTSLLREVERAFYWKHVFVSGSAHTFGSFGEDRMRSFCMMLGEELIKRRYNIVTGLGLNIGDSLIKGALLELHERGERSIERRMCMRPFPRSLPSGMDETKYLRRYRRDMIERSNFAVFLAGTSRNWLNSRGVLQEYELARESNLIPIPIGATGFAAAEIWRDVEGRLGEVYRGAVSPALFSRLNNLELSNIELIEAVFAIMHATTEAFGPAGDSGGT